MTTPHNSASSRRLALFGVPLMLAASTLAGLLAGLLWGQVGRYLSWPLVGCPVLVGLWIWGRGSLRPAPSRRRSRIGQSAAANRSSCE